MPTPPHRFPSVRPYLCALSSVLAGCLLALVAASSASAFNLDDVARRAKRLAAQDYREPERNQPDWLRQIKVTRTLLNAALDGSLKNAEFRTDAHFGFQVPVAVPGVDSAILDPRSTWADGAAYDAQARKLADMFRRNFEKFEAHVDEAVLGAAPATLPLAAE